LPPINIRAGSAPARERPEKGGRAVLRPPITQLGLGLGPI